MKTPKENSKYFEIFPDAKFDIILESKKKVPICTNPGSVQKIINSIVQLDQPPKYIQLEYLSLMEHVLVLVFDGLDIARFNTFKNVLPEFSSLSVSKFPIFVEAYESDGYVVGGWQSITGTPNPKKSLKKYNTYEEMLLTDQQMIDNCYPFNKKGFDIPPVIQFHSYEMKSLTEEELKEFSQLNDHDPNVKREEIIAIDAEMIETSLGIEIARLSATNIKGETILNQLFKPCGNVIDYKTDFSGITEEILKDTEVLSTDCVKVLSTVADKNTIIIGHGLENDLRALKLIHYRCIDTSVLYAGYNMKPSLALLYQKYIKKPFRENRESGHDSAEDARAAAELATFLIKKDSDKERPTIPKMFQRLINKHGPINVIDNKEHINYNGLDKDLSTVATENDEETADQLLKTMNDFVITFAHFNGMNGIPLDATTEKNAAEEFNRLLKKIKDNAPRRTALLVYAPNGNFERVKSENSNIAPGCDPDRRNAFLSIRQGMLWIHCTETNK